MTFGELIKTIKRTGRFGGGQDDFVVDLFEASFGFGIGTISEYNETDNKRPLSKDIAKKWLQRDDMAVSNWIHDVQDNGHNFDHSAFISFLSSRTTMTWGKVQAAFVDMDVSERPLIDCTTPDASAFWRSIMWQFRGIVGLAQTDVAAPHIIDTASVVHKQTARPPLQAAAPFLFSPIITKRKNAVPVYQSGYSDKSTLVLSGTFENGQYLIISYGNFFAEHTNPVYDIQTDLESTLYGLLRRVGGEFSHKRIGVSSGHTEQLTTQNFNRAVKAKLAGDGIVLIDTALPAAALCDVFIVGEPLIPFTESEEDDLLAYIANGGAVVFCSNGWKPAQADSATQGNFEYLPVNQFGKTLGFKIEHGIAGKVVPVGKKLFYFTPLCNAEPKDVEADCPDDLRHLLEAALGGDSEAQWLLGENYEKGTGFPLDMYKAFYWYKMSAFNGNANGQHRLSRCYMGIVPYNIKKNNRLVPAWLIPSSDKGNKYAQGNFGHGYQEGLWGLPVDMHKAIELITASAKQGWIASQVRLGKYYESNGDYENAVLWYTRASSNKDKMRPYVGEAKLRLALLFKDGKGVSRDARKAFILLHEASAYGNEQAVSEKEMLEIEINKNAAALEVDYSMNYYDASIFIGTQYAELTDEEKQKLLAGMEEALEVRIGEHLVEYVGEERIAEYDRLFEDADFVANEIERLHVMQSYIFRANRVRFPASVTDMAVARDIFPEFWLTHNFPECNAMILEQKSLLLQELFSGALVLGGETAEPKNVEAVGSLDTCL